MKVKIINIIPHYVEYDLLLEKAKNTKDLNYIVEYFDFSSENLYLFEPEQIIPRQFSKLFQNLYNIASQKRTLLSLGYSLSLEEKNEKCKLTYSDKNSLTVIPFPLHQWADIEELFLESGLHMVDRHEERRLCYAIPRLKATYEIVVIPNIHSYLYVETQNEAKINEALSIVGYGLEDSTKVE